MKNKSKINLYLLFAALITNIIGYLIKTNNLSEIIFIAGFRVHFTSIILVFFIPILIKNINIKDLILPTFNNQMKKYILLFISHLLIYVTIITLLSVCNIVEIKFADPNYLHEFGLSSIIDFPVYLIWNFPNAFIILLFFMAIRENTDDSKINALLKMTIIYLYTIIPYSGKRINIEFLISEILFMLLLLFYIIIMIKYYKNIYFVYISVFTILWLFCLIFGTESSLWINLFFARNYNSWEGILHLNSKYNIYNLVLFVSVGIMNLIIQKRIIRK